MRKGQHGYFMLETVLATALLVAASAVCLSYAAMQRNIRYTEAAVTAAFLAQEQIAFAEAQSHDYLRTTSDLPWLGTGEVPLTRNGTTFTVVTRATDATADGSVRSIEVTISWIEHARETRQVYRKLVYCHG